MIILDTNVVSELWRSIPESKVLDWVDEQLMETLFLSSITVAELRYGIETLPKGKRRSFFHEALENKLLPNFAGRILPFDLNASKAYAALMGRAKAKGKAIGKEDGYIAAIAAAHDFMVATRDVSPFQNAGIKTINPWEPLENRS